VEPRIDSAVSGAEEAAPADTDTAAVPEAPANAETLVFLSRPIMKAYPGIPFAYKPAFSKPGPIRLRIAQGPDSSMRVEKGRIVWMPMKEGRYPVVLEASTIPGHEGEAAETAKQEFTIKVDRVLDLALKALPAQIGKGEAVTFDLRGSAFPAVAASMLTVRFDYDGDGTWDTEPLPLPANLIHQHAYPSVGRFAPKVEARYKDLETRVAEGRVAVISAVLAALKISPDTVEPGGPVTVDASGSKADGRMVYILDLNGDGRPDWVDSASGRAVLKAPASGVYQASLTARNPMGQEGKASAMLRVNALARLDFKIKNPRENMAAPVEIKARAKDMDDSLIKVRINYTGAAGGWETRTLPPDSVAGPGEWWLRFKHAYGKVGKYSPEVCATSADGREVCRKGAVEVFNAPPVCRPGADLHATLGKPVEIEGSGVDPDGKIVKWEWDLDGDGKYDLISAANGKFQYTFSKEGVFPLKLRVTTADGMTATGTRKVEVRKKWKG
jgi:hypothetical protein